MGPFVVLISFFWWRGKQRRWRWYTALRIERAGGGCHIDESGSCQGVVRIGLPVRPVRPRHVIIETGTVASFGRRLGIGEQLGVFLSLSLLFLLIIYGANLLFSLQVWFEFVILKREFRNVMF